MFYSLAGAALAATSPPAHAAVPSYKDDYGPPAPKQKPAASLNAPPPPYPASAPPKNIDVSRLGLEISYLKTSVSSGAWDSVRSYIRQPGSYVHLLKKSPSPLKPFLVSLEDLALHSTTVFFNEEDRSQVEKLREETGFSDAAAVKEGAGIIRDIEGEIEGLKQQQM